jgi:ferredoxin
MAHIVTANCNDCKYTDCCVVCPVECFYQDEMMLYIDPQDCIDCEACVPECPVEAIYAEGNTPAQWTSYIQLNAEVQQEVVIGHWSLVIGCRSGSGYKPAPEERPMASDQ